MKKLLIAVSAAACALGAFAALEQDSKVTFEAPGYVAGETLVVTNDDDGVAAADSGKGQWYSASPADVDATVTAYAIAPEEGNNNYLNIEFTGKPLYRLIHGMATPDVGTATTETMGEVYIDTMVQFTAGDPDMTSDEDGAKLALWVCGNDENGDPKATTNFMVKAGCFDNGTFTNDVYTMAAPTGVTLTKDAWYRLTVKSYADVGQDTDGKTYQGFVVFVNGEALTPPATYTDDLPDWVTVPEKFAGALVLSMKAADNTLAAVGFSGTGAIDEVTFTATAPDFAKDAQFFTVAWTNGVDTIAFGSDTNITCTTDVGSALLPLAFATNDVTVTYKTGYVAGDWEKGTINAGDTLTIKGIAATCSYEDGEGNTVYVATLADAITKANGATVTLTADIPAGDPISVESTVIIDLAGRTLNCGFTVTTGGSLTINDTIGGGAVVAESVIVFDEAGNITLNAGKYTGAISFDGEEEYEGTFTIANGTKFKNYGDLLADNLINGDTQQLSDPDEDGFVTVQAKQSTVITITFVNGETSTNVAANADGTVTAPTDPTEDGKVFVGWYNGEAKFDASTKFTEGATFNAKWADVAAAEDGDATYDDEASADAVIAHGTKAPAGVTGEAEATYMSYFSGTKTSSEVDGKTVYTVTFVLTSQGETAVKEAMAESAASIPVANVAAGTATTTDITGATPGFYYSIEVADNLSFTSAVEGTRKLATGNSVSDLVIPTVNSDRNARFFRVKANVRRD